MPRIELTANPVDIIAAHRDLAAATTYSIQALSPFNNAVHVDDSDTAPSADEGQVLVSGTRLRAKAGSGGSLWAWAPNKSPNDRVFINVNANVGV